jgi:hypothetical protein
MSSPAFGRGVAPCPATDQRGISRPSAGNCDSGAFEFGVVVSAPLACTTKSLVVGPTTGNCPAGSLPLVKKKCKRKKRHAAASKKRCKKKHKRR